MSENNLQNGGKNFEDQEINDLGVNRQLTAKAAEADMGYYAYKKFKQRQTLALVAVGAIGLGVLLIGFFQIKSGLMVPYSTTFQGSPDSNATAVKVEAVDLQDEDPQLLKQKDTDADGINDFDELYVYETSPYLADSDSDGETDFNEISNNENPNCPIGQNCFMDSMPALSGKTGELSGSAGQAVAAAQNPALDVTADELRSIIVQSGKATKEELAAIDDNTLLNLYQEMLQENPDLAKGAAASQKTTIEDSIAGSAKNVDQAIQSLQTVTPAQVRKMLLEQGIAQSEIDKVDDVTLMELYKEALDTASADVKKE